MKNNTVFQFVLFYNPSEESKNFPEIIDTGFVIASDAEKAKLLAARKLDAEWDARINEVEVLVRPF